MSSLWTPIEVIVASPLFKPQEFIMSIQPCVAGIVSIIVGCLAANAYADPPKIEPAAVSVQAADKPVDESATIETLRARIKRLEEQLDAERATLEDARKWRQALEEKIAVPRRDSKAAADKPRPSQEREGAFTTAVWRFQFYPRQADQPPSERGMIVDTATGRCWVLSLRQPRWEDLGGPYEAVPERRASAGEAEPADAPPTFPANKRRATAVRLKPR
jgi:hypothetical protein